MKNVFGILFLLVFSFSTFADHYHIEKSNEGTNGFNSVKEYVDDKKGIYTLICSDPGYRKDLFTELSSTPLKEYKSKSGEVYDMKAIIELQSNLMKTTKYKKMTFQLESDVFSVANYINGKIIIDIYTGKDAIKRLAKYKG